MRVVDYHGGHVIFVKLNCPEDVIETRLDADSRREFGKLRSLSDYHRLRDSGAFDYPHMPMSDIEIDTSLIHPQEAALAIYQGLQQGKSKPLTSPTKT